MKTGVTLLRTALVAAMGLCLWKAAQARAVAVEEPMAPSAAIGRDIPTTFVAGGPYLLDAFAACDAVSNLVTAGNAISTLANVAVAVVAPAITAYALTNWVPVPGSSPAKRDTL